jgi:pyruvate formate lyase activating enzyme
MVFESGGIGELGSSGKCLGISFTYNEPTVWLEYALEGARLARARGLLTNFVTNGFITLESFDQIGPYLDSFRMDLKGMTKETYQRMAHLDDFAPLLQSAQRAKKKWGMHVEIVTNVIPGFNDSPEELQAIARWIKDHLGPETPWHVTRFYPHYRLSHLSPTAIATLEMARDIGRRSGLTFVYLGNVPGHPGENTYCPRCQRILIHRRGFVVLGNFLRSGCCPDCGTPIPGRF